MPLMPATTIPALVASAMPHPIAGEPPDITRARRRSLAMHRLIANRVVENPASLAKPREFIARQLASGSPAARHWATKWHRLLDGPLDALLSFMVERSEHADQMRKSGPFAGLITSQERWAIIRATRTD